MMSLALHAWHAVKRATFAGVNGAEVVLNYGDALAEHAALTRAACLLDLSGRGRICLTGEDRVRFLNGQVTNNIRTLSPGQGCYAALLTAKGRMESDVHVLCLPDELLLDVEPGLAGGVIQRLKQFVVADDVDVVDLSLSYGLLSVQGPQAAAALAPLELAEVPPTSGYQSVAIHDNALGEWVLVCLPRFNTGGFDLYVPVAALEAVADRLLKGVLAVGGCPAGWEAMETVRIEAGIPRFGQDMDSSTIPLEAGLEERAVRYDKGCYIGQEIINRIHSRGEVRRLLRGLWLPADLPVLPAPGDKLLHEGEPAGFVTSSVESPALGRKVALGYVRKGFCEPGHTLTLAVSSGGFPVEVTRLPFPA